MKHRGWVCFSGFLWLLMGLFLLYKGLRFIAASGLESNTAMTWIGVGLVIGFLKGRFVLGKTVRRVVGRIAALPLPIRFKDVYGPSYWALIALMMGMGMAMRFLPIPVEVRGGIDVAIGSALISGAMLYFRSIYGTGFPAQSQ